MERNDNSEGRVSAEMLKDADKILNDHFDGALEDEMRQAVEDHAADPAEAPSPLEVRDRQARQADPAAAPVEYKQDPQAQQFAQQGMARMKQIEEQIAELTGSALAQQIDHTAKDDPGTAALMESRRGTWLEELRREQQQLGAQLQQASQQAVAHFWDSARQHIPGWSDEKVASSEVREMEAFLNRYGTTLETFVSSGGLQGLKLVYDSWTLSKPAPPSKKPKARRREPDTGRFIEDLSPREAKLERAKRRALRAAGGESQVRKSVEARDKAGIELLRGLL